MRIGTGISGNILITTLYLVGLLVVLTSIQALVRTWVFGTGHKFDRIIAISYLSTVIL